MIIWASRFQVTYVLSIKEFFMSTQELITLPGGFPFPKPKATGPNLSPEQKAGLASLLLLAGNRDLTGAPWHALVKLFPTVPIELLILDKHKRVLLVYREDAEFVGWHHPGSCWNDWETVWERLQKLVASEVVKDAGATIGGPRNIGWLEGMRGDRGAMGSDDRHACSLICIAPLLVDLSPTERVRLFPLDDVPKDTLYHHKYFMKRTSQFFKDGIYLSDLPTPEPDFLDFWKNRLP